MEGMNPLTAPRLTARRRRGSCTATQLSAHLIAMLHTAGQARQNPVLPVAGGEVSPVCHCFPSLLRAAQGDGSVLAADGHLQSKLRLLFRRSFS